MPRTIRPHAPGNIFHLTARTQGKVPWFEPPAMRTRIARTICEAGVITRTPIIAFTVMTNHLHVVVRQGRTPLGWLMHRILHRTALLVKKQYANDGHVFGARYWSGMCEHAMHARQVIIYTHLNAFYAGMCTNCCEYFWNSHSSYTTMSNDRPWNDCVRHQDGLPLFGNGDSSLDALRASYDLHMSYWMNKPKLPGGWKYLCTDDDRAHAPYATSGDAYWSSECAQPMQAFFLGHPSAALSDAATDILKRLAPDLILDEIRFAGARHKLSQIRRELIAALLTRDHRNVEIARCLNVSPALVSAVKADMDEMILRTTSVSLGHS